MKINRDEIQEYLKNNFDKVHRETELSSVYFMITHTNGKQEPLYFYPIDGYFYEAPCNLINIGKSMVGKQLFEYVKERYSCKLAQAYNYEMTMMVDGNHYEIGCPQCIGSGLPEVFDISPLSEKECLKWLIDNQNK